MGFKCPKCKVLFKRGGIIGSITYFYCEKCRKYYNDEGEIIKNPTL